MGLSRRDLFRHVGAAAASASAVPALSVAASSLRGRIWLDGNENAYGPSPKAIAAMEDAARTAASRYPGAEADALRDAIARFHGVLREQIVLGCGSSEILRMTVDALLGPGKTLIQAAPTFQFISLCARRSGAYVVMQPLTSEYAHDLPVMLASCDESTALVYICNPNNPTGTLTSRRDLEHFIAQLPKTTTVLIDEAYHHYVGQSPDYVSFIDRPLYDSRVIVTRSFSAVYGLAGLRVGYAIAAPPTARLLAACRLQQSVNALAAKAAVAALDDREHVRLSGVRNTDDRQEFVNQCHARMLRPIDSATNFVMLDTGLAAGKVADHFNKNNISIESSVPGLSTHIRVSLGTPADMAEFWRVWDLMPVRTGHFSSPRV